MEDKQALQDRIRQLEADLALWDGREHLLCEQIDRLEQRIERMKVDCLAYDARIDELEQQLEGCMKNSLITCPYCFGQFESAGRIEQLEEQKNRLVQELSEAYDRIEYLERQQQ